MIAEIDTATKRTRVPKTTEAWEKLALEIMERVYLGQYNRISKAIRRADRNTIELYLAQQWREEPDIVKQAVKPFYDELVFGNAEQSAARWDLAVNWDEANEALFRVSAQRAGWFSRAMTETSLRQTQMVIRDWIQTPGATVGDLQERVSKVWTGPRPRAAAMTESTALFSQSNIATWQAAGIWGYGVNTRNDDRVRPTHERVAREGPYPLSDTEHQPPIFDDINCRCWMYPVREEPTK